MTRQAVAARVWSETRHLLAFMAAFYMSMDAALWALEAAGIRQWPNLAAAASCLVALAAANIIAPGLPAPGGHHPRPATGPKSPPKGSRAVPPKTLCDGCHARRLKDI